MTLYIAAVVLLVTTAGGCATNSSELQSLRDRYGINLSMPFDNAHDEGPGYLVGPPIRRSVRPTTSSAMNADAQPWPSLSVWK